MHSCLLLCGMEDVNESENPSDFGFAKNCLNPTTHGFELHHKSLVPAKKQRQCSAAGKVTVGLASHRPCVIDSVVYPPQGRERSTHLHSCNSCKEYDTLYLYLSCCSHRITNTVKAWMKRNTNSLKIKMTTLFHV